MSNSTQAQRPASRRSSVTAVNVTSRPALLINTALDRAFQGWLEYWQPHLDMVPTVEAFVEYAIRRGNSPSLAAAYHQRLLARQGMRRRTGNGDDPSDNAAAEQFEAGLTHRWTRTPAMSTADTELQASTVAEFLALLRLVQARSGRNSGQIAVVTGMARSSAYALVDPKRTGLPTKQRQLEMFLNACRLPAHQVRLIMLSWCELRANSTAATATESATPQAGDSPTENAGAPCGTMAPPAATSAQVTPTQSSDDVATAIRQAREPRHHAATTRKPSAARTLVILIVLGVGLWSTWMATTTHQSISAWSLASVICLGNVAGVIEAATPRAEAWLRELSRRWQAHQAAWPPEERYSEY